ncbi:MAG: shikimate kinase [Sulfurospirillum sp.]|nr:shikimate kinase [Sulfurospirillum sp.]MBL0703242.1 shikimate kinase [Sulfurospirillum sp.]
MNKNIIIIGFMGVGKGTVARALAKKNNMFVIDSDDLIESMENREIKTIFKEDGEQYFRNLETKTAKWLNKHVTNTIISTGGGFFKVDGLNKIGKVIYLMSSFESIIQRIKAQTNYKKKFNKRPLLKDIDRAKKLFNERVSLYEAKADIIINVEKQNIDKITNKILEEIK